MKRWIEAILDLVLPATPERKLLRRISTEEFVRLSQLRPGRRGGVEILMSYDNLLVKEAVWSLKYRKDVRVAQIFGKITHDYLLEELSERRDLVSSEPVIVAGIPLSKKRRRKRGYNQMDLVIGELKALDSEGLVEFRSSIIEKIKETPPQTSLGRKERLENLNGAFRVKDRSVAGRDILIIDDVMTTGTTLKSAAEAFRKAGSRNVRLIAIAES